MDPDKVLNDLEHEVDEAEEELHSIEDPENPTERQEKAEDLLNEIHGQIEFLKEVVEEQNQ